MNHMAIEAVEFGVVKDVVIESTIAEVGLGREFGCIVCMLPSHFSNLQLIAFTDRETSAGD